MQLVPLIIGGHTGATNEYHWLEKNILRGAMLSDVQHLVTATNQELSYKTKQQLNFLSQSMSFIVGSVGQNIAAVIAVAASHIAQYHGEDTLIMLALAINPMTIQQSVFEHTISIAKNAALEGHLVIFGNRAYETNKQYETPEKNNYRLQELAGFQFLWNSSLFLFKAGTILQALTIHCPDFLSATLDCLKHCELTQENNSLTLALDPHHFAHIPKCMFDEEVIKKFNGTMVLSCDLNWLEN